jgi:hypothetical protein
LSGGFTAKSSKNKYTAKKRIVNFDPYRIHHKDALMVFMLNKYLVQLLRHQEKQINEG